MKKILNDKFIGKVLKTFLEGFLASLIVSLSSMNTFGDFNIIKNMIVGAIAMGISAVLNVLQGYLNGKGNFKY